MSRGYLVLEDGAVYEGELFGCECKTIGEVVFSTGMSGYQESLTDPASEGQILIMTYPLIGNYGVSDKFDQSGSVHARGLVVREYCCSPSPMFGGVPLDGYLKEAGIPAISGIDTRDLVMKIRSVGTLKGAIVAEGTDIDALVKELSAAADPCEENLVAKVSTKDVVRHDNGKDLTIGIIDCGATRSFLRDMDSMFNTILFPYDTCADDITSAGVQGVIVSDGPGNPSNADIRKTVAKTIEDLSAKVPIYGVGLGGQIVAVALGASTVKLKYGHHGANQPVKFGTRVYITAENHGFAIDSASLEGTDLVLEQFNVNDNSVAGVRHDKLPIMTSQYYSGVSSDCMDVPPLMERFANMVKEGKL